MWKAVDLKVLEVGKRLTHTVQSSSLSRFHLRLLQ